jgi:predicted  nucleic acid-binding Zn-ribbon protein
MHEQVMVLGTLWRLDKARDTLISEARDLANKVHSGRQAIADTEAIIVGFDAQTDALRTTEKAHARRMDSYVKRRENTRRAIDEGRITDFLVAEQQVKDCHAIVESEEEAILELMEQQEVVAKSRVRAVTSLALRQVQLKTARDKETRRRPGLETELNALTVKRDEAREQVRSEVTLVYDKRRRNKQRVMAPLEDKACGSCRVRLPAQNFIDVCRHVDIFLCPNCGCYLAPPLDDDGGDGDGEEDAG